MVNTNTIAAIGNWYRGLLPETIRRSPAVENLKSQFMRLMGPDWIYNTYYYEMHVEGPAHRSAKTIVNSIINEFEVKSVIDVGCGTGALLEEFRDNGCSVFGIDCSQAAIDYCRNRRIPVSRLNLGTDVLVDQGTFDLAVSMEVAEHLSAETAKRYVDFLVRSSKLIVFTAARPGQGGGGHINEQPPHYWIEKFKYRGFRHLKTLSKVLSERWKAAGDVESWYYRNLMIFLHH